MRDNGVLILGDGRFAGHITRRKQRGGPRYYAAGLYTRGTGQPACPASHWASYDAAQAWLLHQAAVILEAETGTRGGKQVELSEEVWRDLLRCAHAAREIAGDAGNQGLRDAAERALRWLAAPPPISYPIAPEGLRLIAPVADATWDYLAANAGSVPDYLAELDDDDDDYGGVAAAR